MTLPFSETAFLDVFGAYNTALWPVVVVLWAITAGVVVGWVRGGRSDRLLLILLAAHWAWSGAVYHWLFFRRINPAAGFFAALFVLQAGLFLWLAVVRRAHFTLDWSVRSAFGMAFVCYGLLYPLVGLWFGFRYPRLPLFAVPCPTLLITAGLLVNASTIPRFVRLVPVLWAVIGGSAAFVLGVRADLALIAAAAMLAVDTLSRSR